MYACSLCISTPYESVQWNIALYTVPSGERSRLGPRAWRRVGVPLLSFRKIAENFFIFFQKLSRIQSDFLHYPSPDFKSAHCLWIKSQYSTQLFLPPLRGTYWPQLLEWYSKCLMQKVQTCYCFLNNLRTKGNKNWDFRHWNEDILGYRSMFKFDWPIYWSSYWSIFSWLLIFFWSIFQEKVSKIWQSFTKKLF
jgi:hypothetical protein